MQPKFEFQNDFKVDIFIVYTLQGTAVFSGLTGPLSIQ